MASCTACETTGNVNVCMGQIAMAKGPASLSAVLGSCLGVTLHHSRTKWGILAHVVLPKATGEALLPGKFADIAIPHMLELLKERGAPPSSLVAKIVGGACMFGAGGPIQIGENNIRIAKQILADTGVRIAAEDLRGNSGRRISFDCGTGLITVETIGKTPRTL
ncbi:MAG: chemotaxis protein CheD [Pirellulales bacterium]|nr:chemotaxis protein CheD [Pirellulales bacterium]